MTLPPIDVVFRDMAPSPMVDVFVRRWATRLHKSFERIEACTVVIEQPHRHHEHGRRFHVRIQLAVPGESIVISHEPGVDAGHEDVYVAVRDAFRAARRRLGPRRRHNRRLPADQQLLENGQ